MTLEELNALFDKQFVFQKLIYTGSDNLVYCLTDVQNKKYILRQARRQKNEDDLAFEAHFSLFLSQHHIPVRLLLNAGPLSLLSFCEGKTLTFDEVTSEQCFNGGKTLAEFHQVSADFHQPPLPQRTITSELERVIPLADKLKEKYTDGATFVDAVKKVLGSPWLTAPNTCIIHNDFRIQNVLFQDSQISAILDFDWACPGRPVKDLAHAMVEWSMPDRDSLKKDRFSAFFKGYTSVSSPVNLDELQFWICLSCLSDAATYLADRIDSSQSVGPIRSWMYQKYLFFNEHALKEFL